MANGNSQPNGQPNGQQQPGSSPQDRPAPTGEAIERALPNPNGVGNSLINQYQIDFSEQPEPYIWPSGRSPPGRWTQDSARLEQIRRFKGVAPAPIAPQIHEARDVVRKAGLYFVQNGSRPSGLRAARMLAWNDKYWKDLLTGRIQMANLAHLNFTNEQEQLNAAVRKEFALFQDAFTRYDRDEDKPKLIETLTGLARRFDDPELEREITERGVDHAMHTLNERVNNNEALLHISAQRANAARLSIAEEKQRAVEQTREQEDQILRTFGLDPSKVPVDPSTLPAVNPTSPGVTAPANPAANPADPPSDPANQGGEDPVDTGPDWLSAPQQQGAIGASQPVQTAAAPVPNPEEAPPYQVAGPPMGPPSIPVAAPVAAPTAIGQAIGTIPTAGTVGAPTDPSTSTVAASNQLIRQYAEDRLLGGKGAPKTGFKRVDAAVTAAEILAENDLRNRLNHIRYDPRWSAITDADGRTDTANAFAARKAAVVNAITQISPRIGQRVEQLVNGSALLTSRQMATWEIPIALAGAADPTFNVNNPTARAQSIRYYTTGIGGRQMLASIVGADHLDALEAAALKLQSWQSNSALWNRFKAWRYTQNPLDENNPQFNQIMADIASYNGLVHNVAPEIEFAISGKPTTVSGRQATEEKWSYLQPWPNLLRVISDTRHLMQVRLADNMATFRAQTGGNPQINLQELWKRYESGGGINDATFDKSMPLGPDMVPLPVQPLYNGGSYTGKLPVFVNTMDEAQRLAPGTRYIIRDGRMFTR